MDKTSATLLEQLRTTRSETVWREFDRIYRPLLMSYAGARGLATDDAEDIVQHCLQQISTSLAGFQYDPNKGRFRSWLRTIVDRRITDLFRRRAIEKRAARETEPPADSTDGIAERWDREWKQAHMRYCLERLRNELSERTYQMFWLYAMEEKPASEVASILGVTENNVWVTRSRVVDRLRSMMAELFGGEDADY